MREISVKALAKINLGLDVIKKREDGYHEVRMVMQTIHLFDRLVITRGPSGRTSSHSYGIRSKGSPEKSAGRAGRITISTNLSVLPVNENNLAYRAARLLMEEFQIADAVDIRLYKHIPVAAGLAGGSTDAAAVLYALNRMFDLGLSKKELMQRGVSLGADVPYCVMRGTALAEGIGEKLTPLPPMVRCPVLIAKPQVNVSTRFVYENLKLGGKMKHPDIDQLIADIREKDLSAIASDMGNVLETVTIPNYPVIAQIREHMLSCGALNAMMSGSGPTVFGLFADEDTAAAAYESMRESGLARQVYLTGIYNTTRA